MPDDNGHNLIPNEHEREAPQTFAETLEALRTGATPKAYPPYRPGDPLGVLDRLVTEYFDGSIEFNVCTGACWSGEVRLTMTDDDGMPATGTTFYAAGAASPDVAATRLLIAVMDWLAEGHEPMPYPQWLKDVGEPEAGEA